MDLEAAANEIQGLSLEQLLFLIPLSYSINERKLSRAVKTSVFSESQSSISFTPSGLLTFCFERKKLRSKNKLLWKLEIKIYA